jgi:hypothetical protein
MAAGEPKYEGGCLLSHLPEPPDNPIYLKIVRFAYFFYRNRGFATSK